MPSGSSLPVAALARRSSFAADARFAPLREAESQQPESDPIGDAFAEGYAAGLADAQAAAAAQALEDTALLDRLRLSFNRLDEEQAEHLRRRLLATVEALCAAAIAPLALDRDALAARTGRAVAMLQRADDERVLRLHPDDITLIAARLPADLAVVPDPTLERGALRLESGLGGVEDGPAHWRRAIAEALTQC